MARHSRTTTIFYRKHAPRSSLVELSPILSATATLGKGPLLCARTVLAELDDNSPYRSGNGRGARFPAGPVYELDRMATNTISFYFAALSKYSQDGTHVFPAIEASLTLTNNHIFAAVAFSVY